MKSRTTPVGILVLALVSLIAVGCSAPTNAVFLALLDPAGTVASSPEADPAMEDPATSSTDPLWWGHPDGYAMVLPAGWTGMVVDEDQTDELVAAVLESMPGLGERVSQVLEGSQVWVSAVAADMSAEGDVTPIMLVLAEPKDGRRPHALKSDVRARLGALPGFTGPLAASDLELPTSEGFRFDYSIVDPDLGELRVFSYLFRWSRTAYLVSFVAPAALADEMEPIFYAIADSLRFGV
jgi:hypothetical protein